MLGSPRCIQTAKPGIKVREQGILLSLDLRMEWLSYSCWLARCVALSDLAYDCRGEEDSTQQGGISDVRVKTDC